MESEKRPHTPGGRDRALQSGEPTKKKTQNTASNGLKGADGTAAPGWSQEDGGVSPSPIPKQAHPLRPSSPRPGADLLVQKDSGGSLSARWKALWQGQMLAPRALLWLLAGQGPQEPSPSLDLKVPGKQAGKRGGRMRGKREEQQRDERLPAQSPPPTGASLPYLYICICTFIFFPLTRRH